MKAPKFWEKSGIMPNLLSPLSFFYAAATKSRLKKAGYKAKIPVVCVGNLVAGGAGKTPTVIALAQELIKAGKKPHIVSKGYGGDFKGVLKVQNQSPKIVGDEPILLSQAATTWVSENRVLGVQAAEENGADIVILDDGFQNPEVQKNFSLLVVDGGYGFGNGKVIPAGPLREPVKEGLKRADAVLVIGKQKKLLPIADMKVFKGNIEIEFDEILKHETLVAFCGIGRPEKFFESLVNAGLNVVEALEFPDHKFYTDEDFKEILGIASAKTSAVVTTEKDMVKVPVHFHKLINPIIAHLKIESVDDLIEMILKKI